MASPVWETGDPTANPPVLTPIYYGPHAHNTMYHWNPAPTAGAPSGGFAWAIFRYGGGFRAGHAALSPIFYYASALAEADSFPLHIFSIDCREAQQQFDQAQFERRKFNSYPSNIEDGVDDVNLAFQYIVENASTWDLNPNLGGMTGTSSGAITAHGAMFLPQPAYYRGFDRGLYPHPVRPAWGCFFEVPWNPLWMDAASGMDYAFVETAHDPDNETEEERNVAYSALGNRLDMFNSYNNVLTSGYSPYVFSGYITNSWSSTTPPSNFSLVNPHDPRHGYFMHKRLAETLSYPDSKHQLHVTGASYGAPAANWWTLHANTSSTTGALWANMKSAISALAGGSYP